MTSLFPQRPASTSPPATGFSTPATSPIDSTFSIRRPMNHENRSPHHVLHSRAYTPPPTSTYHSTPMVPTLSSTSQSHSAASKMFSSLKRSLTSSGPHAPAGVRKSPYFSTPEEEAWRFAPRSSQPALLPPPTFEQIASGLAVGGPSRQRPPPRVAVPPSRSSLKRSPGSSNSSTRTFTPPYHSGSSATAPASTSSASSTYSESVRPRGKKLFMLKTVFKPHSSSTEGGRSSSPTDSNGSWGSSTRKSATKVRFSLGRDDESRLKTVPETEGTTPQMTAQRRLFNKVFNR